MKIDQPLKSGRRDDNMSKVKQYGVELMGEEGFEEYLEERMGD